MFKYKDLTLNLLGFRLMNGVSVTFLIQEKNMGDCTSPGRL